MSDSYQSGGPGGTVIPQLDADGRLPIGRHPTTLAEIEEVFVKRAPNPEIRTRIFRAFELYADMVQEILPSGAMWVDGGFCTHKEAPPADLDVVVLAEPEFATEDTARKLTPLMTLKDMFSPQHQQMLPRLQPMGGLIDGFVILRGNAEQEQYWDNTWSRVKGADGQLIDDARKGYLEVSW